MEDANANFEMSDGVQTLEPRVSAQWQRLMDKGRTTLVQRSFEVSLQHFTTALQLCETHSQLKSRKYLVLGNLGWISRLSGKYPEAITILEEALALADALPGPPTRERIQIWGELGMVYRLTGRHDDAQKIFSEQYKIAKDLGIYGATCRAIGNLGMANYQKALALWTTHNNNNTTNPDPTTTQQILTLLTLATSQLQERVHLASSIHDYEDAHGSSHGPSTRARKASAWQTIGLSRLSLVSTLLATVDSPHNRTTHLAQAEKYALAACTDVGIPNNSSRTMALFFLGRITRLRGDHEKALKYFNPHQSGLLYYGTRCQDTPAIAFAKEPSAENQGYLKELVDVGVDLDAVDRQGYDALEYAVFNGNEESTRIILDGLRRGNISEGEIEARLATAQLRKGYREIFQEKLRPLLQMDGKDTIKKIRRVYAETIAADAQKAGMFDRLKYIRYTDFEAFGRLPRSSDGLVREFELGEDGEDDRNGVDCLIFFSYRWINSDRSLNTPDDVDGTQYRRMVKGVEQFLRENEEVDREKLCIWMDFACVDQDDPSKGVSALPIIVTQCDATISLIDDQYFERAWCCVEAMMIQSLSYNRGRIHKWYEQVPLASTEFWSGGEEKWALKDAQYHYIEMEDKKLTFETDRPKVMFLSRQSNLLQPV